MSVMNNFKNLLRLETNLTVLRPEQLVTQSDLQIEMQLDTKQSENTTQCILITCVAGSKL